MISQLFKLFFCIIAFLGINNYVLCGVPKERMGSSNRVQMRIYRGPSNGHHTQYGYFIRQPSFD